MAAEDLDGREVKGRAAERHDVFQRIVREQHQPAHVHAHEVHALQCHRLRHQVLLQRPAALGQCLFWRAVARRGPGVRARTFAIPAGRAGTSIGNILGAGGVVAALLRVAVVLWARAAEMRLRVRSRISVVRRRAREHGGARSGRERCSRHRYRRGLEVQAVEMAHVYQRLQQNAEHRADEDVDRALEGRHAGGE